MFGIKKEDIWNIVRTNYGLMIFESVLGFVLVFVFQAIPMWLLLIVFIGALIPNLLLHLLLRFNTSRIVLDFGLFFLAFLTIMSLTLIVHYFPDARPSFLLAYVPAIIFSSSQSLSYGATNLVMVLFCFGTLTYLEYSGYKLLLDQAIDYKNISNAWKIGTTTTFFFLLVLSFMSFYFSSILRKRAIKITHLAEINKKLYQKSKTTSDEIISNMKESLVVVDKDLKIVQYNKSFRDLVGHKIALTNEKIKSIKSDLISKINKYLENLNIGSRLDKDLRLKIKDKTFHIYNVSISALKLQNDEMGYIILIDEISPPWGTVYDSKNGKPVDLALVRLMRADNKKVIESKVTDHEGRFGFVITPGEYLLSVLKEKYHFPSKIDKSGYHGDKFLVKSETDGLVKINIPIDIESKK